MHSLEARFMKFLTYMSTHLGIYIMYISGMADFLRPESQSTGGNKLLHIVHFYRSSN